MCCLQFTCSDQLLLFTCQSDIVNGLHFSNLIEKAHVVPYSSKYTLMVADQLALGSVSFAGRGSQGSNLLSFYY